MEEKQHPKYHYRYCPRCGAEGSFNEAEFSFQCPRCGFHFFLNSAAAVAAMIFNERGELLVVRRAVEPYKGFYDLPGGFVDPGESVEEALIREVGEELDLVPESFSYYASFPNRYLFSGAIVYTVDMAFKCFISDFSSMKFRDDIMGVDFIVPGKSTIEMAPFDSLQNFIKKLSDEAYE